MKKLLVSLLIGLAAYVSCDLLSPLRAQFAPSTSPGFFTYSSINFTNAAVATTNAYVVVSALGNGGTPAVTYLDETSDLATHAVRFWWTTNQATVTAASTILTNIVCATNGFAAADTVLLRNLNTDYYQRLVVHSLTATSLLTVNSITNPPAATGGPAVGDIVYRMFITGIVTNGATRSTYNNNTGVAFGQANKPFLIDNTGTSLCFINHAAGQYIK